jgi:hypothetical protein
VCLAFLTFRVQFLSFLPPPPIVEGCDSNGSANNAKKFFFFIVRHGRFDFRNYWLTFQEFIIFEI